MSKMRIPTKEEIFDFHGFMYNVTTDYDRGNGLLKAIENTNPLLHPFKWRKLNKNSRRLQKDLDCADRRFYSAASDFFDIASKGNEWNEIEGPAAMFDNIVMCHRIFVDRQSIIANQKGSDFLHGFICTAIECLSPNNSHDCKSPKDPIKRILDVLQKYSPNRETIPWAAGEIIESLFPSTLLGSIDDALDLLLVCDNAIGRSWTPANYPYYDALRESFEKITKAENPSVISAAKRMVAHVYKQCQTGYAATEHLRNCRKVIEVCAPRTAFGKTECNWDKDPRRELFIELTKLARQADMMDNDAPFANQKQLADTVIERINFNDSHSTALKLAVDVVRTTFSESDNRLQIAISLFERGKDCMSHFPVTDQISFIQELALANLDKRGKVKDGGFHNKLQDQFRICKKSCPPAEKSITDRLRRVEVALF